MTRLHRALFKEWTRQRAVVLSVVCLLAGIGGGWGIRAGQGHAGTGASNAVSAPAALPASNPAARLSQMADAQAAPLLEKLSTDANNPELLANIGNVYYDAQQYASAVSYYQRALEAKPADANVRTDMGTAYWFLGDADTAIAQFDKALAIAPANPNTLFNRGLVKWQGKHDGAGALADWERLLKTNPDYQAKESVLEKMKEVKKDLAATK